MKLDEESRIKESEGLNKLYSEYEKFYVMKPEEDLKEITELLQNSPIVMKSQKRTIQETHRKIYLFTYPSDTLKIKGLISFVPDIKNNPLLVLLRGGNRIWGILNPASDLMCMGNYTILSTCYRDGVSEGQDEFGGKDVNDVKNLITYIPELEKKLNILINHSKAFMLGTSRGGMQMFLALSRFPELQNRFDKIVSLSGMLDLRENIASRKDMRDLLTSDFGLKIGINDEEWINQRDPQLAVNNLRLDLPTLIIQGTNDNRVGLAEGYHMVSKLQSRGSNVSYLEIENGDHCLNNIPERTKMIQNWLME